MTDDIEKKLEKIDDRLEALEQKDKLIRDLENLPLAIESQEIRVLEQSDNVHKQERQLKRWELQEMSKISREVDTEGKTMYKNKELREAELSNRKQKPEYIELSDKLNTLFKEKKTTEINLTYLQHRFSAMKHIARLKAGGY